METNLYFSILKKKFQTNVKIKPSFILVAISPNKKKV